MIRIGQKAPDFSLPDQNGTIHKLSGYLGQWVLIYFYPKDNTPGCTKEACALADNFSEFKKIKAVVLGISADSVASHQKFANKFRLPFPILSDENKTGLKKYGVWQKKNLLGKIFWGTKRMSFLINPKGEIVKIYQAVKPPTHAQEVIDDLKNLERQGV